MRRGLSAEMLNSSSLRQIHDTPFFSIDDYDRVYEEVKAIICRPCPLIACLTPVQKISYNYKPWSLRMKSALFRFSDVSFSYPGCDSVLEDLNLEISAQQLCVIRGESGAGKSTFLQLCNRFCDSSDGVILYHGRDLREYRAEAVRQSVLYLPQIPHVIEGTIEDNLAFPFSFTVHRGKKFHAARAEEWLEYFQLPLSLRDEALKLSVGQKQRISLIRALLLDPEVLLLDEPGSALDEGNKKVIEGKIESLLQSSKVTVLMATHSTVSFTNTDYRDFEISDRTLKEVT